MKAVFDFYSSTVGKKVIVAVTGLLMVGFVVAHMAGNFKMFAGCDATSGVCAMDEYAVSLRTIGADFVGEGTVLWGARFGLLAAFFLHVLTIFQLRARNKRARPSGYVSGNQHRGSFTAAYMFVGGLIVLAFVVFHILHFTTGHALQDFVYGEVYANVHRGFGVWYVVLFYVVAMAALATHLYHGVWSMFQTLGLDNPDRNTLLRIVARTVAVVIFFGFISVPVSVYVGILPAPTL